MPYTVSQLKDDDRFKGMPEHAIAIFAAAFNAALEQYNGDEERAYKVAWAAVKQKYRKGDDGEWVEMSAEVSDEQVEPQEPTLDDKIESAIQEGRVVLMSADSGTLEDGPIERDAKIFEAGRYDDKDIEVTEGDLDKMIQAHESAPIGY